MAKTPKRLVNPFQLANADALVYTVPAATKTIVRHIHIDNVDTSARTVFLSIGTDNAANRILDAQSVAAQAAGVTSNVVDIWCYLVLEAAETLRAHADVASKVNMSINGDELTLG